MTPVFRKPGVKVVNVINHGTDKLDKNRPATGQAKFFESALAGATIIGGTSRTKTMLILNHPNSFHLFQKTLLPKRQPGIA